MAAVATDVDYTTPYFTRVNLADINVNKPDRLGNVFESPFISEMLNDGDQPVSPEDNIVDLPVTPENFSRFQDRRSISYEMDVETTTNFINFLDWLCIPDIPRYIYTYMDSTGGLNIRKELLERHGIEKCVTRPMGVIDYAKCNQPDLFRNELESIERSTPIHLVNHKIRTPNDYQLNYSNYIPYDSYKPFLFEKMAELGNIECLKHLEDLWAAQMSRFHNMETLMILAVRNGNIEMFEYLKKEEYAQKHITYYMDEAAFNGKLEMYKHITSKVGYVNQRSINYAIQEGQIDIVKYVVEDMKVEITEQDVKRAFDYNQDEIATYLECHVEE